MLIGSIHESATEDARRVRSRAGRAAPILAVVSACTSLVAIGGALVVLHSQRSEEISADGSRSRVVAAGAPASAASITVVAWPNGKALEALPYGAEVPLVTVGSATTDASGAYSLHLDMAHLGGAYRDVDGSVDLEVDIATPTQRAAWNLPVSRSEITRDPANVTLSPHVFDLSRGVVSTPGAPGRTEQLSVGAASASRVVGPREEPTSALPAAETTLEPHASPGPDEHPCSTVALNRLPDRKEHFLNVWAWSGAPTTVTEMRGSEHSLGIGISVNGGKWGASGTAEETYGGSLTISTPMIRNNRNIGNSVNYRHFRLTCQGSWHRDVVRPTGFDAMLPANYITQPIGKSPFKHCKAYAAGQAATVNNTSNYTYQGGVDLPFVDLSAHAAMTTATEEHFNFLRRTFYCGNDRDSVTDSDRFAAVGKKP